MTGLRTRVWCFRQAWPREPRPSHLAYNFPQCKKKADEIMMTVCLRSYRVVAKAPRWMAAKCYMSRVKRAMAGELAGMRWPVLL